MPDATKQIDDRADVRELFKQLQAQMPAFEGVLARCSGHWGYEDPVYRLYHQSWKAYELQQPTLEIVNALQALAPSLPLNEWFMRIVHERTGKTFAPEDNQHWLSVTRPILEAFFHARYFLHMAVKCGKESKAPPRMMPSGYAALLYLYSFR